MSKKIVKIATILLGVLIVLLIGFHFWFINHAESLIENMVASRSGGKVQLQVKKFKFNWFSKNMELQDAEFISTDTATASVAYRFAVKRMQLQVKAVLPIIFDKKIMMDSLRLIDPHISVTRLRRSNKEASADTALSIPQEMGRIYHSIQDALQLLKVDGFVIQNGTFTLLDKTDAKAPPMQVSRLHLRLDNLKVDTSETGLDQKILFSDNVVVKTHHQDIQFPDGRHRLSFRHFQIDVQKKIAEFDSCTVLATPGDSTSNSFRIFFEKLRMTNIDFDTLYHKEIIKADSVYCYNPQIRLDVTLNANKQGVTPPRLDVLVQQLAGDMQLAFIVVENGSFDINTDRNGEPSSFTSRNNNFNIKGLQINSKAARPVMVEGFSMAIRNYENFLKDSAYAIRFDSVHLRDNRISLNNFSYTEFIAGKPNQLTIPNFELYGLSWDELVFHRKLKAQSATLYQPTIYFDTRPLRNKQTKDIFSTLAGIGQLVQLDRLDVEQGRIKLVLHDDATLQLHGARFSIKGNELTAARQTSAMLKSIENIHFTSGEYHHRQMNARLSDVNYNSATASLQAGHLTVKNNDLHMQAEQVRLGNWYNNEKDKHTVIENLHWEKATIHWTKPKSQHKSAGGLSLLRVSGKSTRLTGDLNETNFSAVLDEVAASKLELLPGSAPVIAGLRVEGKTLQAGNKQIQFRANSFSFDDGQASYFKDVTFSSATSKDSFLLKAPAIDFTTSTDALLQPVPHIESITLRQPDVVSVSNVNLKKEVVAVTDSFSFSIGKLSLLQPALHISQHENNDTSQIIWNRDEQQNHLTIQGFTFRKKERSRIAAHTLTFAASSFKYKGLNKKIFDAGKGEIEASLEDIAWKEDDLGQGEWKAILRQLSAKNFKLDSIGKQKATWLVETASLADLHITSSLLINLRELAKQNKSFNLRQLTGSYHDSNHVFVWNNAGYNKQSKTIRLDSFSYHPTVDKETFNQRNRYQSDYLTIQTGAIEIGPFELDEFITDTVIHAGRVHVDRLRLTDFRDTRLPRDPGIVRPLLVNTIRKIKAAVKIDSASLSNAHVSYGELNDKTGQTGTIQVNRLNGQITNIKNIGTTATDSLEVKAEAWLQDSLHTLLYVKESYTDSLGGFIMRVQTGPADLRIFNPVLGPLASAHVRSGTVDTMYMDVLGREAFAYGSMQMIYQNLKVTVLDNHLQRKGRFKTKLTQFAINTILKNRNARRSGVVYTERRRDRSAINYLVKTVMSGITSNAGLKKSKRQSRKNKQEINKLLQKSGSK